MKTFFNKVGAFLRKTWVWTLLCVLCVVLLVWFVGPLLAVNDYKFWADSTSRLLSISTLFLAWGLGMVFVGWRAGVHKKAIQATAQGEAGLLRDEEIRKEQREAGSK